MPFNTKAVDNTKTINQAGGEAFTLDDKTALYVNAVTSLGAGTDDGYYVSKEVKNATLINLIDKVAKSDPAFILQLAAYCRNEMNLRSVPVMLLVYGIRAMHQNKKHGAPYPVDIAYFARKILVRPDEVNEAIALWNQLHHAETKTPITNGKHKLPSPLRKAVEIALNSYNEYSMVKYDQDSKEVKFKDVIRMIHPKPKNESQAALFNYFLRGVINKDLMPLTAAREELLKTTSLNDEAKELIEKSRATWETVISKFGSTKETWNLIIPNMGHMALLRNLNNLMKNDVVTDEVINRLQDETEVKNGKQLPFRYYSALKAIGNSGLSYSYSYNRNASELDNWKVGTDVKTKIEKALNKALDISVANIPKFPGRTLCAADVSGSMNTPLNKNSSITYREIACLMSALAGSISENGIAAAFGDTFATTAITPNVLATTKNVAALPVGWSTNAWTILDYLMKNNIEVDRVMYFTDTQCYNSYGTKNLDNLWKQYRATMKAKGKNVYLYEVNLAGGNNTSNFNRNSGVAIIGGWSDKIFDIMSTFENDPRQTVAKIAELYPYESNKVLA